MGGIGSGDGRDAARTSEFHRLDLSKFDNSWFDLYYHGEVRWSQGRFELASIEYELSPYHIELRYSVGAAPHSRPVRETIPFAFTEQPFGGRRRWFVCLFVVRRPLPSTLRGQFVSLS